MWEHSSYIMRVLTLRISTGFGSNAQDWNLTYYSFIPWVLQKALPCHANFHHRFTTTVLWVNSFRTKVMTQLPMLHPIKLSKLQPTNLRNLQRGKFIITPTPHHSTQDRTQYLSIKRTIWHLTTCDYKPLLLTLIFLLIPDYHSLLQLPYNIGIVVILYRNVYSLIKIHRILQATLCKWLHITEVGYSRVDNYLSLSLITCTRRDTHLAPCSCASCISIFVLTSSNALIWLSLSASTRWKYSCLWLRMSFSWNKSNSR